MSILKIRDEDGKIIEIPILKGEKGDKGEQGDTGNDYVLTDNDMNKIAALAAIKIKDENVIGIIDEDNNIILSGNLADGTYTLKYENTDGTYTEIGTLEVGAIPEPEPIKNLADPTSADWQEGYRLSISSGSTQALAGHTVTNFIPCKPGDILRVKGLKIVGFLNGTTSDLANAAKIVYYTSNKAKVGGMYGTIGADESYGENVIVNGDISTLTLLYRNDGVQISHNFSYIRIDGELMSGYTKDDVIITINEEISSDTPDTPDEPTYTNLLPLSVDASGNDYKGTNGEDGYKDGYKISVTGGGESSASGYKCTGFIPIKYDDTLYFKGIGFESTGTNTNFCCYDSSKARIGGNNWRKIFSSGVNGQVVSVAVKDLVLNTGVGDVQDDLQNVAYIRLSASVMDENSIITVNEPIE